MNPCTAWIASCSAFTRISSIPAWLAVLCRNCRHARAAQPFRDLFDREFAYLARLWTVASTRAQFESRYNPYISRRHGI